MVSTDHSQPQRGELWLTRFGAGQVGEPTKTRPALVLSANGQHTRSPFDLIIVAPVSASLLPTLTRPGLMASAESGLEVDSVVVLRAIRGVALSRLVGRLGKVSEQTLEDLGVILQALLGLPD